MTIHINPDIGAEFQRLADAHEADMTGDSDATCDYLSYEDGVISYDGGSPGMYGTYHVGDDGYSIALYHNDELWEGTVPERTEHRVTECADCLFKSVESLLRRAINGE